MIGYSKSDQLDTAIKKKTQKEKNKRANEKLDKIYKELGLYDICEVRIHKNCLKVVKTSNTGIELKMTYAHKEKRIWYKQRGNGHLLGSFEHTVRACIQCHMEMEKNKELTLEIFKRLRPEG